VIRCLLALALAVVAAPVADAREGQTHRIGYVGNSSPSLEPRLLGAFRDGLRDQGYVEGQNLRIEYRWAEGRYDRLPAMAAELVERRPSVIVAFTTPAARAATAATATIPVVFTTIGDPVATGVVDSLSRPGGHMTGAAHLNVEIGPKLLEIMHEVIPSAKSLALMINPNGPNGENAARSIGAAAGTLGVELHILRVGSESDLEAAFATLSQLRPAGLVIAADAFIHSLRERIAATALRLGLPTIYPQRSFPSSGGLMSYAGSNDDGYHRAGIYAGRILKGEKPADLPVHQSTKVEFIINLRTAKALGLNIPLPLLGRADEVIE
jgi:putative ABC transport system substrate-binding protein